MRGEKNEMGREGSANAEVGTRNVLCPVCNWPSTIEGDELICDRLVRAVMSVSYFKTLGITIPSNPQSAIRDPHS